MKLLSIRIAVILGLCFVTVLPVGATPVHHTLPPVLTSIEHKATLFFWQQSNPITGLTKDRASNVGKPDNFTVASIASTGYALASLPISVERGWRSNTVAYNRALLTLKFILYKMPNVHGWYYHFVDWSTGKRVWKCEVSSIDTALMLDGALMAGEYWKGTEVATLANQLYREIDWNWMLTNGGLEGSKDVLSMGWTPEKGFIKSNWDHYCELMLLYLPGLGAPSHPLLKECWDAWDRNAITYKGLQTLAGGPIFLQEMAQGFFNFSEERDNEGWNYAETARNGIIINKLYCSSLAALSKTYAAGYWGLNASDSPSGYSAYGAPFGPQDGTVSPTGVAAAIILAPRQAEQTVQLMQSQLGAQLDGRYGMSDAFNLDKRWFDTDVLGIDLGMAMLSIEDYRTGFPWSLMAKVPGIERGWQAAGLHHSEVENRNVTHQDISKN